MAKPTGHGGIDSPDFLQATTPHANPVEITIAELAVRMGFPHVFERTGNVLFYDRFEYGISDWGLSHDIAANKPVLTSRGLLASPYSAALVIAGGAAGYSYISKRVAYPYLTVFGTEFSFLPTDEFGELLFGYQLYTGADRLSVWIKYNDVTDKWYVYNGVGAFVEFAEQGLGTWDIEAWHTAKVVVDMANLQYARVMIDAEDYSLADYAVEVVAVPAAPRLELVFSTTQLGALVYNLHIDNVIMTINEPT